MNAPLLVITHRAIADESVQTIDSAELHAFLSVTTEHGKWIARRISSYGFVEGTDYVCSTEVASKAQGRGGHNRAVYYVSLDMAKQLAMVERTAKGRQAREYFIACERAAKAAAQHPATLPADLDARLSRIERALVAQESKAAAIDMLTLEVSGAVCLTECAKLLKQKPHAWFIWLSEHQWIFRAHDWSCWQAYQRRINDGHLIHVMVPIERTDGRRELRPQVKVTPAGLRRLAEILDSSSTQSPAPPVPRPTA